MAASKKLENVGISESSPCFIIAEIGQNHQGDVEHAKELIVLAKRCGVNCVKFQKSSLSHRFTQRTLRDSYQSEYSFGSTYGEHRAQLEFSEEDFRQLQDYAENVVGIYFTASAMDIPSADFLMSLEVPFVKLGSGDGNNFLLMDHIAQKHYPIVLSTGMQNLSTVRQAHNRITKYSQEFALLHCVSAYPAPVYDINLRMLTFYQQEFPNTLIGYSGHETGVNVTLAAVAMGAKIIERHFTKDKTQKGTDHQCSLDPTEMKNLVNGIRDIEKALGKPAKTILPSERTCLLKLGKSIVSSCTIPAGNRVTLSDITVKVSRPMGISPENIFNIIGCIAGEDIPEDEPIQTNNLGQVVVAKY